MVNFFLHGVSNNNPEIIASSLEIAAYILGDGLSNQDELGLFVAARCRNAPKEEEGPFMIKGWAVQPYLRFNKNNREKEPRSAQPTPENKGSNRRRLGGGRLIS
eukprot:Tbor_TRINITY_DN6046_c3_g1::TRINITY_DN6046_c3_g1_i4::g.10338::m.10338